jgi:hypothetical protein
MMRAELKAINSPDLLGFPNEKPADSEDFRILIQASIGLPTELGSDVFSFLVASPSPVDDHVPPHGYLWAGRRLVLAEFDATLIIRAIEELCDRLVGEDWREIAGQLSEFADWEFADYRPS